MNQYYGKTVDGVTVTYAPNFSELLSAAGLEDAESEQQLYFSNGWLKIVDDPPSASDKLAVLSACVADHEAKTLTMRYRLVDCDVITADDYDRILEEHLRNTRIARGYTTREPDAYVNSAVPRWRQDAEDWMAFRDQCMMYGLSVMNQYASTGSAPTIEEFKAALPDIQWTYSEAGQ